MSPTSLRRYAVLVLIVTVLSSPWMFIGAHRAMNNMNDNVRQWLPEGFQETREYDWFVEQFGSEEMAIVSWPGCTLDDDRLERLARGLQSITLPSEQSGGEDDRSLFSRIQTPRQALAQLTSPPLNLSRRAAMARLKGNMIGPDGNSCAMLVTVSQAGKKNRSAAVEAIYRVAENEAGLTRDDLRMGGPTADSVALGQESQQSRTLLSGLSIFAALVLAWRCLKNLVLVLSTLTAAIVCAGWSVATVYYTGSQMNLVMTTMPALIYVLIISAGIHLANYYKNAVEKFGEQDAVLRAMKAGLFPCLLTAATTALGLVSLGLSEVLPVKLFGLYSALGIMISLPVLFLFLPAIWILWPIPDGRRREAGEVVIIKFPRPRSCWSSRLALHVSRKHAWITAGCLAVMLIMGMGLVYLRTSVKLLNLFSPDSQIVQDYRWLEENLGPLIPIELVARIDDKDEMRLVDRTMLVADIQHELESMDKVGGTMSLATFVPRIPTGGGFGSITKRSAMDRALNGQHDYLCSTQYLGNANDGQLMRVSARVEAFNSLDYGEFIQEMKRRVEPVVDRYRAMYGAKIEMVYMGLIPLVYKAQNELLSDLMTSFLTAFVLIGIVMCVMLRSLPAGILSMLPNIFPAVLIFGLMAWAGMLCDIGSMMTASIALGIAVDDTIHYLSWLNRGVRQGYSARKSVKLAHHHCATAMLQTTIICGVGLLVFGLSSFVPTSRFSILMFAMLVVALIADLIFLPAMLTGPLGRFFLGSSRRERGMQAKPAAAAAATKIFEPVPQQSVA